MSSNTNLGPTPVNQGYVQLIHIGETGGIDGTLRTIYDGDGTASDLQIASNAVKISTQLYIGSDTIQEYIQDVVGTMFTTGSYTNISTTYDDINGNIDLNATGAISSIIGGTGINATGSGDITIAIDSTVATLTGTQTLTNKTINLSSNTLTGTTAQFNTALSDGSFATLAGTETLTNKTLTSPIISSISNTGTLTLPTSTDTLVGRATTDTLTNKTLTSPTINTSLTFDSVALTAIQTSLEAFADNDTSIMTSAAIQDKILSYGYSTTTGTVTSVSGGNGLTGTITSSGSLNVGAGTHITVNADDVAVNTTTLFASPAFTGTATGVNLTLSGDLTVNGTTTTLDTTNLKVTDNIIELNQGVASNSNDSGIIIERGSTGDNAMIIWDESQDRWVLGTTTATADATGDITFTEGSVQATTFYGALSGNASTATKLGTPRNIAGVAFDGSANIDIPINNLSDVSITSPSANQALIYNFGTGFWENGTAGLTYNGSTANGVLTYGSSTTIDVESTLVYNATGLGVGTGSPGYKLDVNGSLRNYANGSAVFRTESTAAGYGAYNKLITTTNTYDVYALNGDFIIDENGVATRFKIKDTTGHIEIPNDLQYLKFGAGGDGVLYSYEDNFYIGNFTAGKDTIFQNLNSAGSAYVTNLFIDGSAERVGIGTTSPGDKLHIAGNVRIDGGDVLRWNGQAFIDTIGANDIFIRPNGSTAATITAAGSVGIGIASPSTKLHIQDNYDPDDALGYVQIENTNTTSGSPATNASLTTKNYHGTSQFMQWEEHGLRIGTRILTNSGTGDVIFTAGADSEKMRIKSSGNVGIGINSPAQKLHISGGNARIDGHIITQPTYKVYLDGGLDTYIYEPSANVIDFVTAGSRTMQMANTYAYTEDNVLLGVGGDIDFYMSHDGTNSLLANSTGVLTIRQNNNNNSIRFDLNEAGTTSEKFRMEADGDFHAHQDVIAYSTTPSDKKLKTNIKEINYGLDTILKLKPKQYDWKKDNRHDIGFIAQDVEEVIPEIVKDKKHFDKEIKTLDYEKLTAVLIKAVQEQQQQINELKEKLNG